MQDTHHILLEVEEIDGFGLVVPELLLLVASEEEVEVAVFRIGCQRILAVVGFGIEEIDIAELEELHVVDLAVLVEGDTLETAPEQGLAHHVEVAAQGIHDLHVTLWIEIGESFAVGRLGK